MSSIPYSLPQGSANYVPPTPCFCQVLLEHSYGRQAPSHPSLLVFTSQYNPLSTVGTTCYLLLNNQTWQRKWDVTPLVVALCKILSCYQTHCRDFLPSWLGRSKLSCCESICGRKHMVRDHGWPLGAEGDQHPARSWGPRPAAPQPREINLHQPKWVRKWTLSQSSLQMRTQSQMTMIAALWDSTGRTLTPDPR